MITIEPPSTSNLWRLAIRTLERTIVRSKASLNAAIDLGFEVLTEIENNLEESHN